MEALWNTVDTVFKTKHCVLGLTDTPQKHTHIRTLCGSVVIFKALFIQAGPTGIKDHIYKGDTIQNGAAHLVTDGT